jgi:hypothetical protein
VVQHHHDSVVVAVVAGKEIDPLLKLKIVFVIVVIIVVYVEWKWWKAHVGTAAAAYHKRVTRYKKVLSPVFLVWVRGYGCEPGLVDVLPVAS